MSLTWTEIFLIKSVAYKEKTRWPIIAHWTPENQFSERSGFEPWPAAGHCVVFLSSCLNNARV